MTATGLVIIGHVAYEIEKNPDAGWREERYVDLATKVDWRRNAEMWQGNIDLLIRERPGSAHVVTRPA